MENGVNDKIRRRAYEIWEQEGRSGDPEDHWVRAERELRDATGDSGGVAVEDTFPNDAVAAVDSAIR